VAYRFVLAHRPELLALAPRPRAQSSQGDSPVFVERKLGQSPKESP
jgi:hypothetical protein